MITKKITKFNQLIPKLYLSKRFSDLGLQVGKKGKLIPAHKLILSLSSEKLYQIIEDKNVLDLPNYTEECIKEVLNFLYTKELNLSFEMLPFVFQFATEFECTELEKCCVDILMGDLTTETSLKLFDLSQKASLPEFEKKVMSMIFKNVDELLSKKGVFNNLPLSKLYRFVALVNKDGTDQMLIVDRLFEFKQSHQKSLNSIKSISLFNKVRDLVRFNEINLKHLPELRSYQLWTNEEILDLLSLGFSSNSSTRNTKGANNNQRKRDYSEMIVKEDEDEGETNLNLIVKVEENNNQKLKQRRLIASKAKILFLTVQTKKKDLVDIINSLTFGELSSVTVKNPNKQNITLELLQQYQAVFISSTSNYQDAQGLGDLLAEYWKLGGGIVICAVSALSNQKQFAGKLHGAIVQAPIMPVERGVFKKGIRSFLGKVNFPSHPLIKGVKSWDGGSNSFHVNILPLPKTSKVIAEWDDGTPLIVMKRKESENNGRLVILNLLPVSDKVLGSGKRWNTLTDGRVIISNAISYVSHL
ncbi:btb (poz) domain-containing 2a-related [Anaeramoeba flamelloides]|uniref:Btb (Poz) domain-containing 2a-related n=1 Tax=Anaeramoeba flamelloides TaxID=1746091 RepID=A0AAV8A3G3_9EUKA|nr:btb (poz) domain-containing 2a-related [Anaeramoeba flamelloides]